MAQLGAYCGERCLLEPPEPETADFEARTRCDIFCIVKADLIQLCAEQLVPAHRSKLATDLMDEMVRKADMQLEALRGIVSEGMGTAKEKDELERELEELEEKYEELQNKTAAEALPMIYGEVSFKRMDVVRTTHTAHAPPGERTTTFTAHAHAPSVAADHPVPGDQ